MSLTKWPERQKSLYEYHLYMNSLETKEELLNTKVKTKYRSKFYNKIDKENRNEKRCSSKTMGSPQITKVDPKKYLKKGGGFKPEVPQVTHKRHKLNIPRVPARSTLSLNTVRLYEATDTSNVTSNTTSNTTLVNHPLENIRKISSLQSKYSNPKIAVNRFGDTKSLKEVEPVYVLKTSFGKVPKYIIEQHIGDLYDQPAGGEKIEHAKSYKCNLIQEIEHYEMLKNLKENWTETYREYQKLPLKPIKGYVAQKRAQLDNHLNALERDIRLLERHPIIYMKQE